MRVDFVKALQGFLVEDKSSVFITGDLGYNALEEVQKQLGARFLNAGVAEQNMVGVAAGMALAGLKPWIYSITPFVTLRCLEQIRNDVCLHDLPVRVVGNGGGYTYGIMGSTHHGLEDLGALKMLPNMRLFFPCANDHVAKAVLQIHNTGGPTYLRLAISAYNTDVKPLSEHPVTLTRQYSQGSGVTIVGVGHAVQVALKALAEKRIAGEQAAVFGIARYPFDLEKDVELARSIAVTGKVIVLDEHYEAGSIAESFKSQLPAGVTCQLMTAHYFKGQRYGSPAYHLQQCGLTPDKLADLVASLAGEGLRRSA